MVNSVVVKPWVKSGLYLLLASCIYQPCMGGNPHAGLRDPTKPLRFVAETEGLASLSLHSVLISEERKFAVINGKQVREQDVINGARILKIEPGRVKLLINGREKELVMRAQVKQPSRRNSKDPA